MPKTYRVMEAWDEDGKPGKGRVICHNLTEKEADSVLERLYSSDRHWWKEEENGLSDLQGKPA